MDENVNCLTKSEKFFLHEIPENRNATLGMDGRSYRCCCCCEYIPFFLVKKVKYMRCAHSHWTGQLSRATSFIFKKHKHTTKLFTESNDCSSYIVSQIIRSQHQTADAQHIFGNDWFGKCECMHIFYVHCLHVAQCRTICIFTMKNKLFH